jgi:hypothetical protein
MNALRGYVLVPNLLPHFLEESGIGEDRATGRYLLPGGGKPAIYPSFFKRPRNGHFARLRTELQHPALKASFPLPDFSW